MKTHISLSLLTASVLISGAPNHAWAEDRTGIHHAVEVEFQTEPGHYYHLQHSTNLVDWAEVEDAVYGHGAAEDRLFSSRADDHGQNGYYRVVVTDAPTNGLAPWSVSGLTVNLDDRAGGNRLQFLTETNGLKLGSSTDPFAYSLARTGTNDLRVDIRLSSNDSDRVQSYRLSFLTPSSGTWVRDEFRRGSLKDRRTGAFTVGDTATSNPPDNSTPPPPVAPAAIPGTLTGLTYSFQSGSSPDRLVFDSATNGVEYGDDVADNEKNSFTYTYALGESNNAALVVTFKPGKWDEYDLTYSSAAQGTFVRREFKNGVLDDTDRGAFSAANPPGTTTTPTGGTNDNSHSGGADDTTHSSGSDTNTPPSNTGTNTPPTGGGGGTPPSDSGTAPADITGLTYSVDNSVTGDRLIFATADAGTQLSSNGPDIFTYAYKVTGADTASLTLWFKVGRWDEYDLTYVSGSNSGTFVRREFDKNALKRTTNGSFAKAQ